MMTIFKCRTIVGTCCRNSSANDTDDTDDTEEHVISLDQMIVQATYEYGSWNETHARPPCRIICYLGPSCILEVEIQALLMEYNVNHGDHTDAAVLQDCQTAVEQGSKKSKDKKKEKQEQHSDEAEDDEAAVVVTEQVKNRNRCKPIRLTTMKRTISCTVHRMITRGRIKVTP
jgi:hypothetical protein